MINVDDRFITEVLPKIGPKSFTVLVILAKHMNAKKSAFPNEKTISKLSKMGRDAVRNALQDLEEKELIEKKRFRQDNGTFSRVFYTIKTDLIGKFVTGESMGILEDQPVTESQEVA
ncbi:MAG: helix-turn-helix domain-containing protein, partial [Flavobacteriaceae bacterium]